MAYREHAWAAAVKLADFGIARLFGSSCHTMAGTIVGTAEYMAPEQATGGPVDHRVDLYALGLVIYAMLTGRPPFHGGEATDIIRRQRTEAPPRVSTRVAGIPTELDALIERLLAKEPAKRPASALAVGRMLASIATEVGAMPPEPAVPASEAVVSAEVEDPHRWLAQRLRQLPIWIHHGDGDPLFPVHDARRTAAALRAEGAAMRYSELPGFGHNVWDVAFYSEEVLRWLLKQKRPVTDHLGARLP